MECADELNLDLVVMKNESKIAICRLMNYDRYRYRQEKIKKENQKLNRNKLKEVRFRPMIAEHDLKVKANTIDRLLKSKSTIKITINYRGREVNNIGNSGRLMDRILEHISIKHNIVNKIKIEGNRAHMTISPYNINK